MAGIWQVNQQAKTLTHTTPLSRIDEIKAIRYGNKDYVFIVFGSLHDIFVATAANANKSE